MYSRRAVRISLMVSAIVRARAVMSVIFLQSGHPEGYGEELLCVGHRGARQAIREERLRTLRRRPPADREVPLCPGRQWAEQVERRTAIYSVEGGSVDLGRAVLSVKCGLNTS